MGTNQLNYIHENINEGHIKESLDEKKKKFTNYII